jgi:hypothetical protein
LERCGRARKPKRKKPLPKNVSHLLQNGDCLVEVVVLHGAGAVDAGQWRFCVEHEFVVFASVVEIVAQ